MPTASARPKQPPIGSDSAVPTRPFSYAIDAGGSSLLTGAHARSVARTLSIDGLPLPALAARHGTPLYLYSAANIRHRFSLFTQVFAPVPHTVCYAVKALSSLAILQLLAQLGAGFDIVSGGELERVRRACPDALPRVVFSGIGKQAWEIDAALEADILLFNVESAEELDLLAARAHALGKQARFALRVNPDVFAETHPYISTGLREHKFGIDIALARALYRRAASLPGLRATAVSVHIGSQIRAVEPFAEALQRVAQLIQDLRADGHTITHVDAGGGLGIDYTAPLTGSSAISSFAEEGEGAESQTPGEPTVPPEPPAHPEQQVQAYAQALIPIARALDAHLLLEPGRFLVAQAGGLLTRVLTTKQNGQKRFVITDAAMNDLIRPALYQAHHEILPVTLAAEKQGSAPILDTVEAVDVVGPVCESGDFFARDRALPPLASGDLLLLLDAGAYGMSQSSNYNTRPRPAELLIDHGQAHLIRRRETLEDLLAPERLL